MKQNSTFPSFSPGIFLRSLCEETVRLPVALHSLAECLACDLGYVRVIHQASEHRVDLLLCELGEVKRGRWFQRTADGRRVQEARVGLGACDGAVDVLNEVVETENAPPAVGPDIFESEASARVGRVASDNARR